MDLQMLFYTTRLTRKNCLIRKFVLNYWPHSIAHVYLQTGKLLSIYNSARLSTKYEELFLLRKYRFDFAF